MTKMRIFYGLHKLRIQRPPNLHTTPKRIAQLLQNGEKVAGKH